MEFSHHSLLLVFSSTLTCPWLFFCLHYLFGELIDGILDPSVLFLTSPCSAFQASTPYSLESESLRMDCIMSGGASPTLAINAVTNKVLGFESLALSVPQFISPLQKQNKKGICQQTCISGCNVYLFCLLISVVRMWFLTCLDMSYWGGRKTDAKISGAVTI